jgi:hypothetical protein
LTAWNFLGFFQSIGGFLPSSPVATLHAAAGIELCQIQRQMLFTDMMKCSNNTALEQREKSFDAVGVPNYFCLSKANPAILQ